jgi:CRP-like cAMP-binding protein
VLTLDLGPEPHRSIPLLRGLSAAQARIVALLSSLEQVPAGTLLIREGEQGEELYVVIDGKLRAFLEGPDGAVELTTHSRGDTVGEVGLFFEKRTANVEALTDARLLRVTQASLERLARRSPRIAARVHRNLNETLAGRLARLTTRMR